MRRRALLMGGKVIPNTIIGGVGGAINTKALLATKLGISESIIRNFEVVGSDIHCRITSDYVIPSAAFLSDTEINSYYDFDGKCIQIRGQSFEGSNIVNAYLPNGDLFTRAFQDCVLLTNENLSYTYTYNSNYSDGPSCLRNTRIRFFVAPNLTSAPYYGFTGNPDLLEIHAPFSTILASGNNFSGTPNLEVINNMLAVTATQGNFTTNCGVFELNLPNCVSVANNFARDMPRVVSIILSNAPSLPTRASLNFSGLTSCEFIDIRKVKSIGGDASIRGSYYFGSLKTGCLIQINIAMATVNAGSPDAILTWVKANRSAIVEFYDDDGNYVSTL